MSLLIVGLFLFIAVHSVSIVNVSWRDRVTARIGLMTLSLIHI